MVDDIALGKVEQGGEALTYKSPTSGPPSISSKHAGILVYFWSSDDKKGWKKQDSGGQPID